MKCHLMIMARKQVSSPCFLDIESCMVHCLSGTIMSNNVPLALDSVLAFKKRMKLGRFADKDPEAEAKAAAKDEEERLLAESIALGARCEVTVPGAMPKRGVVMFVGM